jgi:hypothetical protein
MGMEEEGVPVNGRRDHDDDMMRRGLSRGLFSLFHFFSFSFRWTKVFLGEGVLGR